MDPVFMDRLWCSHDPRHAADNLVLQTRTKPREAYSERTEDHSQHNNTFVSDISCVLPRLKEPSCSSYCFGGVDDRTEHMVLSSVGVAGVGADWFSARLHTAVWFWFLRNCVANGPSHGHRLEVVQDVYFPCAT